jgi:magnesium-transporting ATPase (P-type)
MRNTSILDCVGVLRTSLIPRTDLWYVLLKCVSDNLLQAALYHAFVLLQVTILTMFTLITLYSTIIPISLYVSIEVYAQFQIQYIL